MTPNVNGTPATAWCPVCGDTHARADGKCAGCGGGVVKAATHETLDARDYGRALGSKVAPALTSVPVAPAPLAVPLPQATKALDLPGGAPTRRWYQQTQAMAESFDRAAREAESRAMSASEEAARYRRAAAAFGSLLKQVNVADIEPGVAVRHRQAPTGHPWAKTHDGRKFDACIECGSTERPHKAKGKCSRCY